MLEDLFGCFSFVDLRDAIEQGGQLRGTQLESYPAQPALDDQIFEQRQSDLRQALQNVAHEVMDLDR